MNQAWVAALSQRRVVRNATEAAQGQPLPGGYSPAVSVQITRAHCWARYEVVVPALRSISRQNLFEQSAHAAARATFDGLFQHQAPFDADVRFPEGVVYLCLDLPPFGPCMSRLNNELRRLQVTAGDGPFSWTDSTKTIAACAKVMQAVAQAIGIATSVWAETENPNNPVLYDRIVFEDRFGLIWADDA